MAAYLLHWIIAAFCLAVTAVLVPGFTITNIPAALAAAIVVGFLNIVLWPLLLIFTLPITILTFGLFLFILNALILKFGAALVPGFTIEGFFPAIIGAIVLTIVGWMVRFVMGSPSV